MKTKLKIDEELVMNLIDEWHESESELSLMEYLGFTKNEYIDFVSGNYVDVKRL